MSKWRPSKLNCLYVIPDIHGANDLLNNILKRILPLRKSDGGKDKIIFLGDYIDRGNSNFQTIETLISLKKKYPEQVIFLCGNHELIMLQALGIVRSESPLSMHYMWIENGGLNTIHNYMQEAGMKEHPLEMGEEWLTGRFKSLIPKEHLEFLLSLESSYQEGDFVFVHGGYDPAYPPTDFDLSTLVWDRSLLKQVLSLINSGKQCNWNDVIITGHNNRGGIPVITDKFMMLDCGSPNRLLVAEVRSREAFMSLPNKSRLVKFDLKNTEPVKKKKSSFRRVSS